MGENENTDGLITFLSDADSTPLKPARNKTFAIVFSFLFPRSPPFFEPCFSCVVSFSARPLVFILRLINEDVLFTLFLFSVVRVELSEVQRLSFFIDIPFLEDPNAFKAPIIRSSVRSHCIVIAHATEIWEPLKFENGFHVFWRENQNSQRNQKNENKYTETKKM